MRSNTTWSTTPVKLLVCSSTTSDADLAAVPPAKSARPPALAAATPSWRATET